MAWQDEVNKQVENLQNTKDFTANFDPSDIEKNKLVSALAYFGWLFWLPMVACPDSKFGKFHANQGLVAFIFYLIVNVARGLISITVNLLFGNPIIGGVTSGAASLLNSIIGWILSAICLLVMLFGLINTLNGKAKELPVIGKIRLMK